jgi:hypothetical protein
VTPVRSSWGGLLLLADRVGVMLVVSHLRCIRTSIDMFVVLGVMMVLDDLTNFKRNALTVFVGYFDPDFLLFLFIFFLFISL